MSYSSSDSIFVRPKIYQDRGMGVEKIYDDEIESYVHRGDNRRNIRRGGGGSSRGSRNVLSKIFTLSMFSNLLSNSPYPGIMDNPHFPEYQIDTYGNYSRRNARKSTYLQAVDHLKRVRRGNRPGALQGDSYSEVGSDVDSDLGSMESIDLGSESSINDGNDSACSLLDGSLSDIEIGEEVFEDSILIDSNYDHIKLLKHDKVIEDDEVPLGCEGSYFTENMTSEEIIERAKNLDNPVPFRDMFLVYNSFHENERRKFNKMQNFLKDIFEKSGQKEHLEEGYIKKAWTYISSYMIQELLRKDFADFNSLYDLDVEKCSLDAYVHFMKMKKSSWNTFLRNMEAIGRKMIYEYVTRGSLNRRNK